MTRKIPTPMPTVEMRTMFGTPGTCSASTWRSGSDSVISIPTTKPIREMTYSLRLHVIAPPTCSQIGVIAISVPSVKSPMPKIKSTAPKMNASSALFDTGIIKKQIRKTKMVIGKTDESDSLHFSFNKLCRICILPSFSVLLVGMYKCFLYYAHRNQVGYWPSPEGMRALIFSMAKAIAAPIAK